MRVVTLKKLISRYIIPQIENMDYATVCDDCYSVLEFTDSDIKTVSKEKDTWVPVPVVTCMCCGNEIQVNMKYLKGHHYEEKKEC